MSVYADRERRREGRSCYLLPRVRAQISGEYGSFIHSYSRSAVLHCTHTPHQKRSLRCRSVTR